MKIGTLNLDHSLRHIHCPACKNTTYTKNGKEKDIQRYKCKSCGRNFRSTTHTPAYKLHKKQLLAQYIECIHQGLSLRQSARQCGIALGTSFTWRHKLLKQLHLNTSKASNSYTSISAFTIPFSQKGRRNPIPVKTKTITSIVKHNHKTCALTLIQKSQAKQIIQNLNPSLIQYSKSPKLTRHIKKHLTPLAGEAQANIIETHNKIHLWLDKFRGVATKYINHYWAWFNLNEQIQLHQNKFLWLIEPA